MSDSFRNNDRIVVDLYDQKISKLPIEDPYELENVLIHAAQKLTDNNEAVILEVLLNTLVDYYVFDLEPGDDIEDVGFLVSDIEDRVCNAIALRRYLLDRGSDDELGCSTCKAARMIVKSKETSEVTVGFVPHRPYQGMRPEQSEGVKPLGQSGEMQDSMYRTAKVNRAC